MMEKETSREDSVKIKVKDIQKFLKEVDLDEMSRGNYITFYTRLADAESYLEQEAQRQKEQAKMTPEIALKCLANINSCSGCPLNKQDKIDCRDEAIGFGALAIQKCMEEDMKIVD